MRHAALLITLVSLLPACRCQTESSPAPQAPARPVLGSIMGTVRFSGAVKTEISHGFPTSGIRLDPSKLRTIIVGKNGELANAYIAVRSGLENRRYPTSNHDVLLRQVGFVYEPRVLGLMTDQLLKVRNDDDTMHNVHIERKYAAPFNEVQQGKGDERTLQFTETEIGRPIKCDVHPWERAWVHVSDHPFFAVTGIDGKYSIAGLPPGNYEILAWHERFKDAPLVAKVKVTAGGTATLDFTFEGTRR